MGQCCSGDESSQKTVVVNQAEPIADGGMAQQVVSNIRLCCITWNVGDAPPSALEPMFSHLREPDGKPADIIVVAVQECRYKVPVEGEVHSVPMGDSDDDEEPKEEEETSPERIAAAAFETEAADNAAAASNARQSRSSTVADHWQERLKSAARGYTIVARKGLWSIRVSVLARDEIADQIADIQVSREATGVASVGGNKGGVAIGLRFCGTRMMFVGSHLAAHLEKVQARNSDFHEIVAGITANSSGPSAEGSGLKSSQRIGPFDMHHHVFWMGDLNYRIGGGATAEDVIAATKAGKHAAFLVKDQLLNEMNHGNVFAGFQEAKITFTPTYRFLRNTTGEQRDFDPWKSRVPSWCDRVLHRGHSDVTTLKYDAEHGVRSSDHSPVYAVFDVPAQELLEQQAARRGEAKSWTVRVTNVSCTGLVDADVGSLSDPYVVFTVLACTEAPARSRTVDNDLNPAWNKADDIFDVKLAGKRTLADVQLRCVHALVFDEDVVADDSLGCAMIPLRGLAEYEKRPFDIDVLLSGKRSGKMKGVVEILPRS